MTRVVPREGWTPTEVGFGLASVAIHTGALVLNALGEAGLPLRCTFRLLARFPCPTCGTTRALLALDRGEVGAAFAFHPIAAAIGIYMWVFPLYLAWSWWSARAVEPGRAARALAFYGGLGGLAALWCARLATGTLPA